MVFKKTSGEEMNIKINEQRALAVYIIIMFLAGMIFFRLYTVAVSDYTKAMPSLTGQYTTKLNVVERRGFIFDRNGIALAGFEDGFVCVTDPSKIDIPVDAAAEVIANAGNLSKEDALSKLMTGKPFVTRITEETDNEYMTSYKTYTRHSSNEFLAAHILGYLDGGGNGVSGVEFAYDEFLKKTSAKIEAVYDSDAVQKSFKGSPIKIIDYAYDVNTGIMLTIESRLQRKLEEIADRLLPKGAIVVVSVPTGEILASVSRPTYSADNLLEYIDSTEGEFVNRAFSAFTPGSVFKTVISAAALESDTKYYETKYTCVGEIYVGGKRFGCHKASGHGELDMQGAYAHSCNTYYMNLALELGYEKIYDMAKKFKIGEKIYLDGLNAQCGNMPKIDNPPPALIANTAIGQGELLITPLEAARIFCCIANGGVMPELSIVKSFVFSALQSSDSRQNFNGTKILDDKTVEYLLKMTQSCVEYGTGTSAKPEKGGAGGKTSSAESGQYIETATSDDSGAADNENEKTQIVHSWFSGYYPCSAVDTSRRPLYAISVIAEGGVTSNIKSASIFKEVCDYLGIFLYN